MRALLVFTLVLGLRAVPAFAAAEPIRGTEVLSEADIVVQPGTKGMVVVFLSAKCPCSKSHAQELKDLSQEFSAFKFVGVHANSDEGLDLGKSYFKETALPFPVLRDSQAKLANRFRALKTPHVFVVSNDGQIVFQGGVSNSRKADTADRHYLREALGDLQAGLKVRTPEARSLGCIIKRSADVP